MNTPIEAHTDGSLWVACTPSEPKSGKTIGNTRIYHPDAKIIGSDKYGSDDHYECPNCKDRWWVEYDG